MSHALRRPRSQLAVAAVAVLLGVLIVVQIRAQTTGSRLDALSAPELTALVANLNTRNDQLRAEIATIQQQLDQLSGAQARGDTSLGEIQTDLARVRAWAGLEPVSGQGVEITITGGLPGTAVDDLLNELHNAGAEAIAVGGVRVVPGAVVAGDPGELSIEDTALGDPLKIVAVGQSATLTGSLTRAGGIIAQLKATFDHVDVTVTPMGVLSVPATERQLVPSHGTPRL